MFRGLEIVLLFLLCFFLLARTAFAQGVPSQIAMECLEDDSERVFSYFKPDPSEVEERLSCMRMHLKSLHILSQTWGDLISPFARYRLGLPRAGSPAYGIGTFGSADMLATTHSEKKISSDDGVASDSSDLSSPTKEEDFETALSLLKGAAYGTARVRFQHYLEREDISATEQATALYWVGRSYFVRGEYDRSVAYFLRSYKKSPRNPDSDSVLLYLSMSLGYLDKIREACATARKLTRNIPQDPQILWQLNQLKKQYECS